jgi:hypothetical protein
MEFLYIILDATELISFLVLTINFGRDFDVTSGGGASRTRDENVVHRAAPLYLVWLEHLSHRLNIAFHSHT